MIKSSKLNFKDLFPCKCPDMSLKLSVHVQTGIKNNILLLRPVRLAFVQLQQHSIHDHRLCRTLQTRLRFQSQHDHD